MRPPFHRRDLPWADTVLDTRDLGHFTPLPEHLPEPFGDRSLELDGWTAVPYVLPGGRLDSCPSVLLLTAPDGWRGAVVLTQYSGRKFPYGQLRAVLPYLSRLLSPGNTTQATLQYLHDRAVEALPMLRTAMNDPLGWDPDLLTDDEDAPHMNRYLLTWASAGAHSADAGILEDHQVRPIDTSAIRNDLRDWHRAGFTDPHEVALWHEAWCRRPREASALAKAGFSAAQAYAWTETPLDPVGIPSETRRFIDTGWTPAAVREIGAQVLQRAHVRNPADRLTFFGVAGCWAKAMSGSRASAYLSAGWGLGEATEAESSGHAPDTDTLTMLAGLRTAPTAWRVSDAAMGTPTDFMPEH